MRSRNSLTLIPLLIAAFTFSSPRYHSQHSLAPNAFTWASPAPTAAELLATINHQVAYPDPFFSKEEDVPKVAKEFGGKRFVLLSNSLKHLPEFETGLRPTGKELKGRTRTRARKTKAWEWSEPPLSRLQAEDWLEKEAKGKSTLLKAGQKWAS